MTDINTIIPEEAKQDLVDVNQLWDLMIAKVKELIAESRKIDFGGVGGAKSVKDYAANLKLAADNQQKLANQTANYTILNKELQQAENRLTKSLQEENKQITALNETRKQYNYQVKQQVIAENAAFGSLTHLRAELNRTKAEYAALGVTIRQSDIGKALQLQINRFDNEVKRLEGEIGVFGRNVGNYQGALTGAMGVQGQFQQLLRELPNAGISARTFLIAITNNITYFGEAVQQARLQGNSWKQILSSMGSSMFGLVGILNLAVLGLTVFGTKMLEASASTTKAEESAKRYADAISEASLNASKSAVEEITRLDTLYGVATNVNAAMEIRVGAVKEMQRLYPAVLGNMEQEAILTGLAADEMQRLADNLIKKAAAQAAEEKVSATGKRILELKEQIKTQKELAKIADAKKFTKGAEDETGVTFALASGDAGAARKNRKELEKELAETEQLQKQYAQQAIDAASQVLGLFDDTTDPRGGSEATKRLSDESKAQFDIQTADLKRQIELNKELANDDSRTYEDRIESLEQYYDLKRQLILQTAEYEKQVGNKTALEQSLIDENTQLQLIDLTNETLGIETKAALKSLENERAINEQKKQNLSDLTAWAKKENDQRVKDEEEAAKKRMALITKVTQLGIQAGDMLRSIRNSHHQEDMNELNRQDEANRNALDREIARIQRSTLSQQEKEEAIREAEAKSEIKRRQIENERRDREQRAAAFDRDVAMFQMMLSMFQGIAKEVGTGGVKGIVTAAAITAFMGGIITAAGRLRTPRYAKGTDSHPGGLAIVGDGGEQERIDLPGGQSFFSPATDTLMDLPKGTSVTPVSKMIEDTNGMLSPKVLNTLMLESRGNTARMERLMAQKLDQVKEAIESKPVYRTTFSNGYVRESMYRGNIEVKFIKKRL